MGTKKVFQVNITTKEGDEEKRSSKLVVGNNIADVAAWANENVNGKVTQINELPAECVIL